MKIKGNSINQEWVYTIRSITVKGVEVEPRGQKTSEILHHTVSVDMRYPVLTIPSRRLSYRFMAAEAYWILSGDDSVEGIAPWNSKIASYSDDGKTFFGAYGPKIVSQLKYVVEKLQTDQDTRQAGMTIWRESPPDTKDVPCTVAIFANIRNYKLNLHVFMRSSDVWLGLPYDVFNFSMLGHLICGHLLNGYISKLPVEPGNLYLTAMSSHIYHRNLDDANECSNCDLPNDETPTPSLLHQSPKLLMTTLKKIRDSSKDKDLRWWEKS
jgi:thymidylate synthase